MALPEAALDDFRAALKAFQAAFAGVSAPGGAGKALEAWIFMTLARGLVRTAPWIVTLRRGDGSTLPAGASFNLPTHGSGIQASSLSAPGYVLIQDSTDQSRRFELRGSVEWKGRSGATHEIDISLAPGVACEALRNGSGGFLQGLPILAIECKDKTSVGTLDEMRQTLARMFDLALVTQPKSPSSCRIYEDVTNTKWGKRSSTYLAYFNRGVFAVVRAGSFQSGAATLGEHYQIKKYGLIYAPKNLALQALCQHLRSALRKSAKW